MLESYELAKLEPSSFEHMANALALRILGAGYSSFAPGPDGGRDGYFEGEAPYPSMSERWSGVWYIQSKFHKPHLSSDPQKWLLSQIRAELEEFKNPSSKRKWPDNWIVVTNVDPSGVPETGAFDSARNLVGESRPDLMDRFHIWGGKKVIDLLSKHQDVADMYGHFLTPGHVLARLRELLLEGRITADNFVNYLVVKQFREQQFTKLEQAGSDADTRPGIHNLFIDLPCRCHQHDADGYAVQFLVSAAAKNHRVDPKQPLDKGWLKWQNHPLRARTWFVRGGPGQGKSTIGQYFCQVQRAALILEKDIAVLPNVYAMAEEVREKAVQNKHWTSVPRVPLYIELKEYAHWLGKRRKHQATGVLTYLSERISAEIEQDASPGFIRDSLGASSWFVAFDGLDEVPNDVKDKVAQEIRHFVEDVTVQAGADLLSFCTSRPQGYSGQFAQLGAPAIDLVGLSASEAISCAMPVISLGRTEGEVKKASQILHSAVQSTSVRELMTTPLQAHIMAVVVRDGGRPPDRRWQLYNNFYEVIRRREANRDLPAEHIAKLLREDEQLLRAIHNRLGFALHAAAENSAGAQTSLSRTEFRKLAREAVSQLVEHNVDDTMCTLMEATTNRLVLVNTPDDGEHVRFDIRSLQEFFAAEFIYDSIDSEELRKRLDAIAGDSHWREVMHFLLSALVEKVRPTELSACIDVLNTLNNGLGEDLERVLNRRLARGALLVARLLQEGVLEQDKRMRQRFRQVIEPLAGLSDYKSLQNLLRVAHANSHSWLVSIMVERLKEADHSENIGASVVLCHILSDSDPARDEAARYLRNAPRQYLGAVLRSYISCDRADNNSSAWLTELALFALLDDRWRDLGITGIRAALNILRGQKEDLGARLEGRSHRVAQEHLAALKILLADSHHADDVEFIRFGGLMVSYYKSDWTSRSAPPFNLADNVEYPGILGLASSIVKFSQDRSRESLIRIYDSLGEDATALLGLIPPPLACFVPTVDNHHWLPTLVARIKAMSDHLFSRCLRSRQIEVFKLRRLPAARELRTEKVNALELYEEDPHVALIIAFERDMERFRFIRKGQRRNLAERCIVEPEFLAQLPHLWGNAVQAAEAKGGRLRDALLSECQQHFNPLLKHVFIRRPGYSLELNLPKEAAFLPYVLASFRIVSPDDIGYPSFNRATLEEQIAQLCPKIDPLLDVLVAEQTTLLQKAAAVLIAVMHKKGGVEVLLTHRGYVVDAVKAFPERWLMESIALVASVFCSEEMPAARSMVSDLLDFFRGDYDMRAIMQDIIAKWRESSRSPVRSANLQQRWLEGVST